MLKKMLVVCGQTATGKTKLAIHLAKILASGPVASGKVASGPVNDSEESTTRREGSGPVGEIISSDSRQVYRGMDIGTGKDLPKNSKFKIQNSKLRGAYTVSGVPVWGYDLAEPNEDFSVSDFSRIANQIVADIWTRGKLPIIVGGTGFYIKALVDGIGTSSISPDHKLRTRLESKNAQELLDILRNADHVKADTMNDSDIKNPRRLIRAIEIAYQVSNIPPTLPLRRAGKYQVSSNGKINYDSVMLVGLTAPKNILYKRIEDRVYKRINKGFEKEVESLINNGVDWNCKSMQGMGYRQYEDYYNKKISRKEFLEYWIFAEQKYSKRQMVWFRKDKRINWFDVGSPNWKSGVEKKIESWYYEEGGKSAHKNLDGQKG